jgi:hypothetical protein
MFAHSRPIRTDTRCSIIDPNVSRVAVRHLPFATCHLPLVRAAEPHPSGEWPMASGNAFFTCQRATAATRRGPAPFARTPSYTKRYGDFNKIPPRWLQPVARPGIAPKKISKPG